MKSLDLGISRVSAAYDPVRQEMDIFVYWHQEGTFKASLNFFEHRTLSELWILMSKVKKTSELNIILYERLKEFAYKAGPEVIRLPYQVKYLGAKSIQSFNLDPKSMKLHSAKDLVWMENLLRTTGFQSPEKTGATDCLKSYCEKHLKRYNQMRNKLKTVRALPVMPVGQATERERAYDTDLLKALDEDEEGELDGQGTSK